MHIIDKDNLELCIKSHRGKKLKPSMNSSLGKQNRNKVWKVTTISESFKHKLDKSSSANSVNQIVYSK